MEWPQKAWRWTTATQIYTHWSINIRLHMYWRIEKVKHIWRLFKDTFSITIWYGIFFWSRLRTKQTICFTRWQTILTKLFWGIALVIMGFSPLPSSSVAGGLPWFSMKHYAWVISWEPKEKRNEMSKIPTTKLKYDFGLQLVWLTNISASIFFF